MSEAMRRLGCGDLLHARLEGAPAMTLALAASAALGPLLAWGVARLVGRPVPPVAMSGGAVAVTASLLAAPDAPAAASLPLGLALLTLAAADVTSFRLPDALTLPLGLAGLGWTFAVGGEVMEHAAGAGVGFGSLALLDLAYRRLRGRSGIGLGDAKLFAAAGAWLGLHALGSVLLVAAGGGLAWAAMRHMRRGRSAIDAPLPFGAPLAAAFWLLWLWSGAG